MFSAIIVLGGLALALGAVLGYAAIRFKVEGNPVVEQVDSILPQAQCGKCGYPGCHPYAEAIVKGEANINLCPPGGEGAMRALAQLLDKEPQPVGANESGLHPEPAKMVAFIDETRCIGCTLCIQACPVDAIVGTNKMMHTVVAGECTGCELCVKPCPVECILMTPMTASPSTWKWPYPSSSRTFAQAA